MPHRWDGGSREHPAPPALLFVELSPREIEVLEMVRDDATNEVIAHELGMSEQTVKNHLSSAFNKLGVQSRTAAVVRAIRAGVIPLHSGQEPHPDGPALMEAISAVRVRIEGELDDLVKAVARMRRPD